MKIAQNITELIGKTPLLRLRKIEAKYGVPAELVAKVEMVNPGGSAKDRVALAMIEDAERRGVLRPGMRIIEPTSGNTGIGLALVGAAKGYDVTVVMPDSMSPERRRLMTAFGAKVELTPGAEGMQGAVARAEELCRESGKAWIPQQFTNPANAMAHELTTAEEIWADTDGKIDVFIAGIGTGGTLTGVSHVLKKKRPEVHIVGMEPAASPLLTAGKAGPHKLQGIGANFIPEVLDRKAYDEVLTVTDDDALAMTRELAHTEGLLVGISSGAAVVAAIAVAKRPEYAGKRIVMLLPDTGTRYLSAGIYD